MFVCVRQCCVCLCARASGCQCVSVCVCVCVCPCVSVLLQPMLMRCPRSCGTWAALQVGHGCVNCFSIYCGDDIDFREVLAPGDAAAAAPLTSSLAESEAAPASDSAPASDPASASDPAPASGPDSSSSSSSSSSGGGSGGGGAGARGTVPQRRLWVDVWPEVEKDESGRPKWEGGKVRWVGRLQHTLQIHMHPTLGNSRRVGSLRQPKHPAGLEASLLHPQQTSKQGALCLRPPGLAAWHFILYCPPGCHPKSIKGPPSDLWHPTALRPSPVPQPLQHHNLLLKSFAGSLLAGFMPHGSHKLLHI